MIAYGEIIQTTAIFSIAIMAPIGAILINSLGPELLDKETYESDKEENEKLESDGRTLSPSSET